jgi:hypothetical protein
MEVVSEKLMLEGREEVFDWQTMARYLPSAESVAVCNISELIWNLRTDL